MTGKIRVLSASLADQIAAGEVVERPASVIKELVENAIDAGATRVSVEVEEGGVRLMRVTDDGSGMAREDAALCIQRHATSKLRTPDQLFALNTLGFRGEALPSIASVCRFELRTRTREDVAGTLVQVEGGGKAEVGDVGCAAGTSVCVRDLFYNVPARLKFLRAKATENGRIAATLLRIALAHPGLQLSLTRDGRRAKEWLRARDFAERVQAGFPGETLTSIEGDDDGLRFEAVLGPPERARSGATGLHLLINGRPVKDVSLARAVAFAYGSVLPPGRYPIGAVHVHLPPDEVDVNVHPQKSEVRLRDGRRRYDALTRALARALGTSAWRGPSARPTSYWNANLRGASGPSTDNAPGARSSRSTSAGERMPDRVSDLDARLERAFASGPPLGAGQAQPPGAAEPTGEADPWGLGPIVGPRASGNGAPPRSDQGPAQPTLGHTPEAGYFGRMRVLGQVRQMLLICEGPDGIHMLDQHAADERVRYHQFRRAYQAGHVKAQALLFPERVECSEGEAALVEERQADIAALGLECRLLGPTTVAVHSVPAILRRASPEQLLRDLLGELEGKGERAFGDAVDMALATMACHAAIRAGDTLSPGECQALLKQLDEVDDFGGHCPHGRPVAFSIGFDDLERRLGR